jgi:transcriptional regulator with XRE-family HTH domain
MSEQNQSGFGPRLRELREAAGLTQEGLAQLAGMHKFGIAKLERGEREPSWATVKTLAKALGVNCLAFQDEEEPPTAPPTGRQRGRPRKAVTPIEGDLAAAPDMPAARTKPRRRKTPRLGGG